MDSGGNGCVELTVPARFHAHATVCLTNCAGRIVDLDLPRGFDHALLRKEIAMELRVATLLAGAVPVLFAICPTIGMAHAAHATHATPGSSIQASGS